MKRFITLWFCMIALLYSFSSIAGAMDSLIKGSAEKTITQQINQLTSKPATTQPVSVKQVSAKKLSAKKETTPTSDFIDNNNGTVTHRTTGLTWQRCAMGQTWTDSTCSGVAKGYSYKQALALKDGFAGYSDWRVPTIEELRTIVERGNTAPAINKTLFPNTPLCAFRSSSFVPEYGGDYAWVVNFYDGKDDYSEDDGEGCGSCASVRLVRSGQSSSSSPTLANTQADVSQSNSVKVSEYSSSAIWESKVGTVFLDCITSDHTKELNCILAKMKQSGASQEAMSFVKQFTAPEESIGWLSEFKEKGRVDLGVVQFANRANTNDAYVLLNGNPSLVSTELGCTVGGAWHQPCQSREVDISHDPNYPRLKNQYPNIELWPAGADFKSMQSNADGGQRFIFSYRLVNGCHACEVAGTAEITFDFSGDGTFKGTKLLGLVGVEAEKTANVIEPLEVTKPTEQINTTNPQFNMANSTQQVQNQNFAGSPILSTDTTSDDPCQEINDSVTKFVSEMPSLSSSQLTNGRFNVENNTGGLSVSYLINGQEIFKREWHESCGSGELDKLGCSAQITPILGVDGYGGLHIAQQASHIGLTCDHLIFPSPFTSSFKSASQPWFITVKDLDNDNISEIITHEYQQWALDCNLCLACIDATAWNNIYHLSPEGRLIPVNEQFPQRYTELLAQYRKQYDSFKQDAKNYDNGCSSQQLNNQFQALINRAETISKVPPIPSPTTHEYNPNAISDATIPAKGVNITTRPSITIITHGYASSGDRNHWPNALASAISARDSGNRSAAEGGDVPIYLLTIDRDGINSNNVTVINPEQLPRNFSSNVVHNGDGKSKSSAIVIVNWSGADGGCDYPLCTPGGALGAVPTDRITQLIANYILKSPDAMALPIHLIGHSRGGAVMLSLATILARQGLWVEQLTTLDPHPIPHDFEGGMGIAIGDPFRATNRELDPKQDHLKIPNNVIFADTYRQWLNDPEGHILDGALDVNLTEVLTPTTRPLWQNHSDVHGWYHFTTDLNASSFVIGGTTSSLDAGWYDANSRTTKGFNISRHKMNVSSWRTLCSNSLNTSCGLHEEISGKSAPRFFVEVDRSIARPSILIDQVLNPDLRLVGPPVIRVGDQLQISVYYSAPANPADIIINLDDDMNPFNDAQMPASEICQSFGSLLALSVNPTPRTTTQTIKKATLQVTLEKPSFTTDKSCFIRVTIKDKKDKSYKRIDYIQRAITIMSKSLSSPSEF